jgi:acyl-CoA reductase-like NAD-dependent aldehyde dehydrogenase
VTEPPEPVEIPTVSGGERSALETAACEGVGGRLATVARTPAVLARDAIETARTEGFDALAALPVRELLARLADAGRRFEGIGPGTDGLADRATYLERVARAGGHPVGWAGVSAHWLGYGLRHAGEALRAQSPTGGLEVYDDGTYVRERDVGLMFAPRVRSLGCAMPGNDPATYAWPLLALAMKLPVVIRPSDRDPFTPLRLARALRAAGVPEPAVHVLPGERSLADVVVRESDHALAFGGEDAVAPYRADPAVQAYGPGRSVAVVGREPTDAELDTLARGVGRAGGRTCFNLTRVVAVGDCGADALADRLARRVLERTATGSVLDSRTDLPAFPDRERGRRVAEGVAAAADRGRDVTASHREGPRSWSDDEGVRVAPTVLRVADAVPELPLPFAGVTDRRVGEPRAFVDSLAPAYLGVAVGAPDIERAMARSPAVRKLYGGRYPASVDLRETHEEYLTAVCYETTTYDPGSGPGSGSGPGG